MTAISLGNRMKSYEAVTNYHLTPRMPKIIRIDGKAFHTYTKGMQRPFDEAMTTVWTEVAKYLCKNIMGAKIAYFQSDECSILLTDYDKHDTQAWFDNQVQKIASVSASMATAVWNREMAKFYPDKLAVFDSRVYDVPKEDVCNYFIWRQRDCSKNSIASVAQANFPHGRLHKLSTDQMQELLFQEKGINWAHLPNYQKNGTCVVKNQVFVTSEHGEAWRSVWEPDMNIPIFSQDREYIEKYL